MREPDSQVIRWDAAGREIAGRRRNGFQHLKYQRAMALVGQRIAHCTRFVDVGCSGGGLPALMAERYGASVVGVEPEVGTLLRLPPGPTGVRWVAGLWQSLPFASGAIQGVAAMEVIGYLTPAGQRVAMAETLRILEPGGWLLFSAWTARRRRLIPESEWRPLLAEHFTIEAEMTLHGGLYESAYAVLERIADRLTHPADLLERLVQGTTTTPPAHCRSGKKWRLLHRLAQSPRSGRRLLALAVILCRSGAGSLVTIRESKTLARLCQVLGQTLMPTRSRTGVILFCRKPSAGAVQSAPGQSG
ncbi:MAG: class I SAM-dependent methyltransferase [Magnetococcales bacterium]|nr:class I SAM-dependent methyltransferase [Magnetococcales bacterium]